MNYIQDLLKKIDEKIKNQLKENDNNSFKDKYDSLNNITILNSLPELLNKDTDLLLGRNPFNPSHITIIERQSINSKFDNKNYKMLLELFNDMEKPFNESMEFHLGYHMNNELDYQGSYFFYVSNPEINPAKVAYIKLKDSDIFNTYNYISEEEKALFKKEYGFEFRSPVNTLSLFSALHEMSHAREIQFKINNLFQANEEIMTYYNENDADFNASLFLFNKFSDLKSKQLIFEELISIRGMEEVLAKKYCEENNKEYKPTHSTIKAIKMAYEISKQEKELKPEEINSYSNKFVERLINNPEFKLEDLLNKKQNKNKIKP